MSDLLAEADRVGRPVADLIDEGRWTFEGGAYWRAPPLRYFELREVVVPQPYPNEFRLTTAALLVCELCTDVIEGMGGPGHGAVCKRCGELVLSQRARGAVVWEDET